MVGVEDRKVGAWGPKGTGWWLGRKKLQGRIFCVAGCEDTVFVFLQLDSVFMFLQFLSKRNGFGRDGQEVDL